MACPVEDGENNHRVAVQKVKHAVLAESFERRTAHVGEADSVEQGVAGQGIRDGGHLIQEVVAQAGAPKKPVGLCSRNEKTPFDAEWHLD